MNKGIWSIISACFTGIEQCFALPILVLVQRVLCTVNCQLDP